MAAEEGDAVDTAGEDADLKESSEKPAGDPTAAEQAKGAYATSEGEMGVVPSGEVLKPGTSGN